MSSALIDKNKRIVALLKARGHDTTALYECTVCRQTGGPATCECHWCGGTAEVSFGTFVSQAATGEGDMA